MVAQREQAKMGHYYLRVRSCVVQVMPGWPVVRHVCPGDNPILDGGRDLGLGGWAGGWRRLL